jgi:hypothetical protein
LVYLRGYIIGVWRVIDIPELEGQGGRMALGDETTQNDATGDLALGQLAEALAAGLRRGRLAGAYAA